MDSNFRFPDRSAARSQLAVALRYIIKLQRGLLLGEDVALSASRAWL